MQNLTNQSVSPSLPGEATPERTIAIRQAITTGERGLVLTNMDDFARFAMKVAASQLCPPGFSEVDCFIILQCGAELGLTPMLALQSFYIVNNRASLFGDMPKALVERSGLMSDYSQEETGEYPNDDYGYKITTLRKGRSKPIVTTYTVADARRAKVWEKKIERNGRSIDTPWITAPKRMLMWRARAFNLRDNFPDVLKGFQIAELVDEEGLAGFEHAKAAVATARTVEPRFSQEAPPDEESLERSADAGEPADLKDQPPKPRRGRPPKAQVPAEPQEPAQQPSQPEPHKETPGAPKGDLFEPKQTETTPAAAIVNRLIAEQIPMQKFLELLHSEGFLEQVDITDIRAGHIGIQKLEPADLAMAYRNLEYIVKALKG